MNVYDSTLVYMVMPFIGIITNLFNKLRVEIVGPEPRMDTAKVSPQRKVAAIATAITTAALLQYLPGWLGSLFGASAISVFGYNLSLSLPIGTGLVLLAVAFVLKDVLLTSSPLLMAILV